MIAAVMVMSVVAAAGSSRQVADSRQGSDAGHVERRDQASGAPQGPLGSRYEQVLYKVGAYSGQMLVRQFMPSGTTQAEIEVVARGFHDGALGRMKAVEAMHATSPLDLRTLREAWQKERRESEASFVKEASKQRGVVLLDNGVVFMLLRRKRELPTGDTDEVVVSMTISKSDGSMAGSRPAVRVSMESAKKRPTWLQKVFPRMKVGGQARLFVPPGVDLDGATAEWEAAVIDLELLEVGTRR